MPVPTGLLYILDGGALFTTLTLDASGNYSFDFGSFTVGSHSLTASYPGDANFLPSVSPIVVEVVNPIPSKQPSATTLVVVPNPAIVGQNVNISGSVTG